LIWLELNTISPVDVESGRVGDRNDAGRFMLENYILKKLEASPLTEATHSPERVTKYVGSRDYETFYVLRQQDGRVTAVKCQVTRCKALTTWKGMFAITY